MKRLLLPFAALMLLIVPALAQDDVYFTPKKKKTNTQDVTSTYVPSTQPTDQLDGEDWYVGRGPVMDVDAYNRRYVPADTLQYNDEYEEGPIAYDYDEPSPTSLLVRFHGYYDPWYYSPLAWDYYYGTPYYWYHDPWMYGSWGHRYWGYNYGWSPYWNYPWLGGPGWGHHPNHYPGIVPHIANKGHRGGTRTTAGTTPSRPSSWNRNYTGTRPRSTAGNTSRSGSRIGATGVQNPGTRGGYAGGTRTSTYNGGTRTSTKTPTYTPQRSSKSSNSTSSYSEPSASSSFGSSRSSSRSSSSGSSYSSGGSYSRSSGGNYSSGSRGGRR